MLGRSRVGASLKANQSHLPWSIIACGLPSPIGVIMKLIVITLSNKKIIKTNHNKKTHKEINKLPLIPSLHRRYYQV